MQDIAAYVLFFLLSCPLLLLLRTLIQSPTELDRVGSDLSLVGYGVAVSLLVAIIRGESVLVGLGDRQTVMMLVIFGFLYCMVAYLFTLRLSTLLRQIDQATFRDGLEFEHLRAAAAHPKGKRYLTLSLALTLFPAAALLLLDLLRNQHQH